MCCLEAQLSHTFVLGDVSGLFVTTGDVLNAFKIVFETQSCDFTSDIKTKGVLSAVSILYSKEFIDDILYCKKEKEEFIDQILGIILCAKDFHNRYASIPYDKDNYSQYYQE